MKTWKIGVVGGGKMGVGIAQLFAMNNHEVKVVYVGNDLERNDSAANMEKNLSFLAQNGVIEVQDLLPIMERVTYTTELEDLAGFADIVFECVVEELAIKQEYFKKLDEICAVETVLASNTSAISITEIGALAKHKERIIGTHYWNPAYLIPLVEVIKTRFVSEPIVEKTFAILLSARKKPVLVKKDVPGFLANRLQHALFREAISIVENEIATPADVDEAIKYGFGMRLGISAPFEVMDMAGLDLTYNIHSYLFPHIEDTHEAQKSLVDHIETGRLGFKSGGKGYQDWTEERMQLANQELNEKLIKVARALGRL